MCKFNTKSFLKIWKNKLSFIRNSLGENSGRCMFFFFDGVWSFWRQRPSARVWNVIKFQIHSQSWQFVHLHQTSGGTSDSKWDEGWHVCRCNLGLPHRQRFGSRYSKKRRLMKKTLKFRLEGQIRWRDECVCGTYWLTKTKTNGKIIKTRGREALKVTRGQIYVYLRLCLDIQTSVHSCSNSRHEKPDTCCMMSSAVAHLHFSPSSLQSR